jgi:probable addiction module antidote protein
MVEHFSPYEPADALGTIEAIKVFMDDAFETGDASHIAAALGVVARAKGMTELSTKTGLSREQLYRTLSADGNPTLKTTLSILKAMGLSLTVAPVQGDLA